MSDDHSELEPPLPIPNRAVKRLSADDSADYPCESRTSSGTQKGKARSRKRSGFFLLCVDFCAPNRLITPRQSAARRVSTNAQPHRRATKTSAGRYPSMVRLTIKRSRLLAAAFAVVHVLAAATLVPLDFPLAAKIAVAVLILTSLASSMWRHALLRYKGSIAGLQVRDMETASFQTRDGLWHEARILGTSYVTPGLTVLNLRTAGARLARHVFLVADNANREDFRQLRVVLRWRHCRGIPDENNQSELSRPLSDDAVPF
jgi:toxin CptA